MSQLQQAREVLAAAREKYEEVLARIDDDELADAYLVDNAAAQEDLLRVIAAGSKTRKSFS